MTRFWLVQSWVLDWLEQWKLDFAWRGWLLMIQMYCSFFGKKILKAARNVYFLRCSYRERERLRRSLRGKTISFGTIFCVWNCCTEDGRLSWGPDLVNEIVSWGFLKPAHSVLVLIYCRLMCNIVYSCTSFLSCIMYVCTVHHPLKWNEEI